MAKDNVVKTKILITILGVVFVAGGLVYLARATSTNLAKHCDVDEKRDIAAHDDIDELEKVNIGVSKDIEQMQKDIGTIQTNMTAQTQLMTDIVRALPKPK